MPYIDKEARDDFAAVVDFKNLGRMIGNAGELNYVISSIVASYLESHDAINYAAINEVVGVIECAKLEMYRRIAVPYENIKIEDNGDVYLIKK